MSQSADRDAKSRFSPRPSPGSTGADVVNKEGEEEEEKTHLRSKYTLLLHGARGDNGGLSQPSIGDVQGLGKHVL